MSWTAPKGRRRPMWCVCQLDGLRFYREEVFMRRSVFILLLLVLAGNFFITGCYSKPPGSEPQKPSEQSSEQQ